MTRDCALYKLQKNQAPQNNMYPFHRKVGRQYADRKTGITDFERDG